MTNFKIHCQRMPMVMTNISLDFDVNELGWILYSACMLIADSANPEKSISG